MVQFFYDGQIRRYLTQVIRLFSNFVVKRGDGTLERIPVMYGDMDRQVATIINQNSENNLNSAPRIAVYISQLSLDRNRLADSSFVGKLHIRERDITNDNYGFAQGQNFTVERLMPTPFMLQFKVDIWSASTEQKLQIMEQILTLFNPSLEIQTTDNYIDWTSLSVVDLNDINFSSRTIPVGTSTQIDVATLTLETPIWLSPPAKIKKLGVITNIVANVFGNITERDPDYIEGLGTDTFSGSVGYSDLLFSYKTAIGNFDILVDGKDIKLLSNTSGQQNVSWSGLIDQYPGKYVPGLIKVFLKQVDGTEVVGYGALNPLSKNILTISEWDIDTYPTNDLIPGPGRNESSWGTFDAIIDPHKISPELFNNRIIGTRYLIVENIGGGIRETFTTTASINLINTEIEFDKIYDYKIIVNGYEVQSTSINKQGLFYIQTSDVIPINSTVRYELYVNEDGPDAWKNTDGSDFIADANDIIEWDGEKWGVVFSANASKDYLIYQTNIYTLVQYKWNGMSWVKSFEGEYKSGEWRIEL
jgi:hypothetical protein